MNKTIKQLLIPFAFSMLMPEVQAEELTKADGENKEKSLKRKYLPYGDIWSAKGRSPIIYWKLESHQSVHPQP